MTTTSWWVGKDRDAFNTALKDHTHRVMTREVPAARVLPPPELPAPPAPDPVRHPRASKPWQPGSRGRVPRTVKPLLELAASMRTAILASDAVVGDEPLARAAIVMFVGFVFRQRLDWVVQWTGFAASECKRVAARLRRYGIWRKDGTIVCRWMEAAVARTVPKRDAFTYELAFWLDALVAKGELTREPADGDFKYGLTKWETP